MSPLGVYLLETVDFSPKHKDVLQRLLLWVDEICAKAIKVADLQPLRERGYRIMAEMELLFPLFHCTFAKHSLSHSPDTIEDCGPAPYVWMYVAVCLSFVEFCAQIVQ
jgi:hypothetical protein